MKKGEAVENGIGIVLVPYLYIPKNQDNPSTVSIKNLKAQLRLKSLKFNKNTFTTALDAYLSKHPEWSREGRSLVYRREVVAAA